MKDSISSVAIFQIVIVFILLFTGIMSLTINKTRAFGIKNDIVTTIEELEGVDLHAYKLNDELVFSMTDASYRSVSKCPDAKPAYYGFDRAGVKNDTNPSICIRVINVFDELDRQNIPYLVEEAQKGCYYQVLVFYKLDFPVLKEVFSFSLLGETKVMYSDMC